MKITTYDKIYIPNETRKLQNIKKLTKEKNLLRDHIFMTSSLKDGMREETGIENCRVFPNSTAHLCK